jgi:addiction module RelE/StbE family toxin
MIEINYAAAFVRQYKKLNKNLQIEVKEKIELFIDKNNRKSLKIHELSGRLSGTLSFSVNYSYRIIFEYLDKNKKSVALLKIGDHTIYE